MKGKVSGIIKALQEIKETHGDLPAVMTQTTEKSKVKSGEDIVLVGVMISGIPHIRY